MISNNVKHLSKSNEHYTPPGILRKVRNVIGEIELDPASSATANETVQAKYYFTKEEDGLLEDWFGNVFLNPPGGKIVNKSSQKIWWIKLVDEWIKGNVSEAIFLAFSIELLQTSQTEVPLYHVGEYTLCIPSKRISFINEEGYYQSSPTHANVIIHLPNKKNRMKSKDKFFDSFYTLGTIMNRC